MLTRRFVCLLAGMLLSGSAVGEFKPDSSALVKDLESVTSADGRVTLVLWLPTEFWRASFESSGKITPAEIDRFTKEIDHVVIVSVADGQEGIAGSVTFLEPDVLRSSVTVENSRGEVFSPLPDEEISSGVRNLTQVMRPVLANMLGSLGTHLALIVFPGTAKSGERTVDAAREGVFIVHVGKVAARYRLPLGSLLPPATDAKTGESFPGNYHFNPYTGGKLVPAPADKAKSPSEPATTPSPASDATARP